MRGNLVAYLGTLGLTNISCDAANVAPSFQTASILAGNCHRIKRVVVVIRPVVVAPVDSAEAVLAVAAAADPAAAVGAAAADLVMET